MQHSKRLFSKAQQVIPGGVNSPVRAFKGVGGEPVFFKRGEGPYLFDVDNRKYIDYVGSWGPLILGHCHPTVIRAVTDALTSGMSFGAPTVLEIQLAEKIVELIPSIEKVRMVNSGTEATMTAVRLARAFTQKKKIIKFNGCYHGHSDGLLVQSGSGLLTLSIPATPGIPSSVTEHTLVAEYNDITQVRALFEQYPQDIAAVIVEPVAGNMGFVRPKEAFLQQLRDITLDYDSVLIFDEVMTGFRVALGGAQSVYDITPDLTTLGKIIGGGMPVGALGGKATIMDYLAPLGPVYQAGTLSGNPLAMAAGLSTLTLLEQPECYSELSEKTAFLLRGLTDIARSFDLPFQAAHLGGMFGFQFTELDPIYNLADVSCSDDALFRAFFHGMIDEGVYFAPSMFEAGFMSMAHQDQDIRRTHEAAEKVLGRLASARK